MKFHIALLAGLVSVAAFAITNEKATESKYNKPDFKGFCTTHNANDKYMGTGICDSLDEGLNQNKCFGEGGGLTSAQLLEEIRLRYLGEFEKIKSNKGMTNAEGKDRTKSGLSLGTDCGVWGEAAKDKAKFASLFKQFLMTVAISQSNLNPLFNVEPGAASNPEANRGIYNLKTSDMDKETYKCGCENINSESQGGDEVTGPSPGSRDGHHSIVCGAYMALYHIAKDGTLFGGNKNDPNSKPEGAAKIFPSLLSNFKDGKERNQELEQLNKKMGFYCEKLQNPNGTLRTFDNEVKTIPGN